MKLEQVASSYEKARIENGYIDEAERLEKQSQQYLKELELAKFHEERGKIKCDCYSCAEQKTRQKEAQEQILSDYDTENKEKQKIECPECGKLRVLDEEAGVCKSCVKNRKNITKLDIRNKNLESHLDLKDFTNLKVLNCSYNKLTSIDLTGLNQLEEVQCPGNYLTNFDYSVLNSEKLTILNISDNNLTEQDFIKEIFSSSEKRPNSKVKAIKVGLTPNNDYYFANYLKGKEQNYPDKEKTKIIYLNQQLTGVLDCQGYNNLKYIVISTSVDSSKFEIKEGSYRYRKIKTCQPAQTYLDENYPKNGTCQIKDESKDVDNFGKTRAEITELVIDQKGLEGNLDLTDFLNLEKLYCHDNYLTQIIYPTNPEKITSLYISDNNLPTSDLTIFSPMRNLRYLDIGNTDKNKINQGIYNRWVDSCEPLKDLELSSLDIKNTDLTSGFKPDEASCAIEWIKQGFKEFIDLRDGYEYFGTCPECQQPNSKRNKDEYYDVNRQAKSRDYRTVALKILSNSQQLNQDFLQELTLYKMFRSSVSQMVPCYGISQDPAGNYIMVMQYMAEGNLREYLKKNYQELERYDEKQEPNNRPTAREISSMVGESEFYHQRSKNLELDLDNYNLDELNIQEDPQEQSSHQAQIEVPPKGNN
ncbi:4524_t:CDS:10 [Entrophospora sp. SA101]|nr:4524_t:CDS:10 [Entrophospora sp. SA101]